MSKSNKTRLIRLGDAKRLTKAGDPTGTLEANPMLKTRFG